MAEIIINSPTDWFEKQAKKEAMRDALKRLDRFGQIIGIAGVLICIVFFGLHLSMSTGFFTTAFGALDTALFFGISIFGIVPQVIRLIKGRKTPARPFDIFNSALILVALIYFLATFPFDFSHLADPLPASLEFLLNWISNGLASAVMVLGIIGMLIALPYQTLLYNSIRELPPEVKEQPPDDAQPAKPEEAPEGSK